MKRKKEVISKQLSKKMNSAVLANRTSLVLKGASPIGGIITAATTRNIFAGGAVFLTGALVVSRLKKYSRHRKGEVYLSVVGRPRIAKKVAQGIHNPYERTVIELLGSFKAKKEKKLFLRLFSGNASQKETRVFEKIVNRKMRMHHDVRVRGLGHFLRGVSGIDVERFRKKVYNILRKRAGENLEKLENVEFSRKVNLEIVGVCSKLAVENVLDIFRITDKKRRMEVVSVAQKIINRNEMLRAWEKETNVYEDSFVKRQTKEIDLLLGSVVSGRSFSMAYKKVFTSLLHASESIIYEYAKDLTN